MQVGKDAVVVMDYTLKDSQGRVIDSSVGKQPLTYLHGVDRLVEGLEKVLIGKSAGESLHVVVPPEEGYGMRDESLVHVVPKSSFQGVPEVKVGSKFRTQSQGGGVGVVTVTKVDGDQVTVDGNLDHAGKALHFDVTIKEVRAATKEELAHGHVHGPGGHHHH